MSLVVRAAGRRLAAGSEVGIVANDTLVAIASNVNLARIGGASRAIAEYAMMNDRHLGDGGDWLEEGCEAMVRVCVLRTLDAVIAVVKVRTFETLVTNTNDILQTG